MESSFKAMATRYINAENSFMDYVMGNTGCNEKQAANLMQLYKTEKILKFSYVNGDWKVNHGAWLDEDVLKRLIAGKPQ